MNRNDWKDLILAQPPGLSLSELGRRIQHPDQRVRYWARRVGYEFHDGRRTPSPDKFNPMRKVNYAEIDWSIKNTDLAAKHRISRQRVWEIRRKFGPPIP